jgi:hypothetical protein
MDQGLAIGDLLCLNRHRKATMAADMHSLDSQLVDQNVHHRQEKSQFNEEDGPEEAECPPKYQEELHNKSDGQARPYMYGPAQVG